MPEGELAEGQRRVDIEPEFRVIEQLLAVVVPEFAVLVDGRLGQLVQRVGVELEDQARRQEVGIHPGDRHALLDVERVVLLVFLEDLLRDNSVDVEDVVEARSDGRFAVLHALRDVRPFLVFLPAVDQLLIAHAGDGDFRIGLVAPEPLLERGPGRRTEPGIVLIADVFRVIGVAKRVLGDDRDVATVEGRAPLGGFLGMKRPVGFPMFGLLALDEGHEGRHEPARIGATVVDRILVHAAHHVRAVHVAEPVACLAAPVEVAPKRQE